MRTPTHHLRRSAPATLWPGLVVAWLSMSGFGPTHDQVPLPLDTGHPQPVQLDATWPPQASRLGVPLTTDSLGQSRGHANDGALVGAVALPRGPGYFLRHPARTWATASTVKHIQTVVERVRAEFPRLHRLAIGDLSLRHGGPLSGHRSHQSGRDVDLGFFYRERPFFYPLAFAPADRDTLHFRATWTLLEALAATADNPDGVDYILLDYRVQGMLHRWATREGIDPATVERLLQFPRGRRAPEGLVRHFPNHSDHLHVRFKCPPQDLLCLADRTGPQRPATAESGPRRRARERSSTVRSQRRRPPRSPGGAA